VVIVHRLHAGASRYYLAAVGPAADGAPRLGETAGWWTGGAAARRGLQGTVDGRELRRLLPEDRGRVPGFDITFAAPKSVSVLHALGHPDVSDAVRRAHQDAVLAGVGYLERHACAVRVRGRVVPATGFVAAAFTHRTSRAADPHLHTHVVVANGASGPDGLTRALHTPLLYAERRGAEATYHVVLRGRLTASLGLMWDAPTKGRADTVAVPPEVRAAFSTRRAAVLAEASGELGERRWAERVTRPSRHGLIDHDGLRVEWSARATALGWVPTTATVARDAVRPFAGAHLLPTSDRWTRADLMVALADHWVDGAPDAELRNACDRLLSSVRVVLLPRGMQAADRFTTHDAARRVSDVAEALRGRAVAADPETIDGVRRRLAADGRRLLVVVADDATAGLAAARTGAEAVAIAGAASAVADLRAGDVVVLDRAGRLPSAHVAAVLSAAAVRHVDVFAGDHHDGADRRWIQADPLVALTIAISGGDVTASPTARTAADTAIGDWLARRRTGEAAVIVAEAPEVDALNARARAALRQAGMLGPVEVGGFAVGDRVRFSRARPGRAIARHTQGDVVVADPAHGLEVRLLDGRDLALRSSDLRGVRHAHVVPPLPALIGGCGDVFVVGGRIVGSRHLGGNQLHRYVTVDGPALAARRWAEHPGLPDRSPDMTPDPPWSRRRPPLAVRALDRGAGLSR
jgi:conjugative relaxase-like TrwC/TraI family protein